MADSTHNTESTTTTPSPDQMYCHACHHQWQRQGETLECPACNSETTEIVSNQTPPTTSMDDRTSLTPERQITPENDPRLFHRRPMPVTVEDALEDEEPQPDRSATENSEQNDARPQTEGNHSSTTSGNTPTSDEANGQGTQEQNGNASTTTTTTTNTTNNNEAPRSGSRPTNTQHFDIRFIFPPVTFFTTVISEPVAPQSQQQSAGTQPNSQAQSSQQSNEQPNNQQSNASSTSTNGATPNGSTASGPSPITFFGLHFFTPRPPHVYTAPAPNATANTTQTEGTAQQQPQSNGEQSQASEQQQPQQDPQPATQGQGPIPAGLMNAFLSAMFSPFSPLVLGNLNFVNDGVYSQEAFDRIITQLREQHAAQNPGGAPPASQAAIEKLRVRDIDEQMLQGCQDNKTKCVICVDDMTLGDKATLLPCNHFFHGECVTPWLKVHNTCPVCRRSVEVEEAPESKKRKNMAEHEPTGRDGHGIDEAEDEEGQSAAPAIPERQRRPYGPERLRGEGTDCA